MPQGLLIETETETCEEPKMLGGIPYDKECWDEVFKQVEHNNKIQHLLNKYPDSTLQEILNPENTEDFDDQEEIDMMEGE